MKYAIVPIDKIPKQEEIVSPPKNLVQLYNFGADMVSLCLLHEGVGLAAVQIGVPWKFFIICRSPVDYSFMVDCEYEPVGDIKKPSMEGCLSLRTSAGKSRTFMLSRYEKVRVVGQELKATGSTLHLEPVDQIFEGFEAVVYQHEIEHQRGILISDVGEEMIVRKGL